MDKRYSNLASVCDILTLEILAGRYEGDAVLWRGYSIDAIQRALKINHLNPEYAKRLRYYKECADDEGEHSDNEDRDHEMDRMDDSDQVDKGADENKGRNEVVDILPEVSSVNNEEQLHTSPSISPRNQIRQDQVTHITARDSESGVAAGDGPQYAANEDEDTSQTAVRASNMTKTHGSPPFETRAIVGQKIDSAALRYTAPASPSPSPNTGHADAQVASPSNSTFLLETLHEHHKAILQTNEAFSSLQINIETMFNTHQDDIRAYKEETSAVMINLKDELRQVTSDISGWFGQERKSAEEAGLKSVSLEERLSERMGKIEERLHRLEKGQSQSQTLQQSPRVRLEQAQAQAQAQSQSQSQTNENEHTPGLGTRRTHEEWPGRPASEEEGTVISLYCGVANVFYSLID